MFEDMLGSARDKTQAELVSAVLSCTTDENEATAKTALEVLSVLALNTQKPISKVRSRRRVCLCCRLLSVAQLVPGLHYLEQSA